MCRRTQDVDTPSRSAAARTSKSEFDVSGDCVFPSSTQAELVSEKADDFTHAYLYRGFRLVLRVCKQKEWMKGAKWEGIRANGLRERSPPCGRCRRLRRPPGRRNTLVCVCSSLRPSGT